jgi:hypothetical protein
VRAPSTPGAVFNYVPQQHGVAQLPDKAAFDKCDKAVATIRSAPSDPPPYRYTIPASPPAGSAQRNVLYFGCPVANHCATGQKIQINIVGAGGAYAPAPAPSPYGMMMAAAPEAVEMP